MTRPFALVPTAAFWAIDVRSIFHATMPRLAGITTCMSAPRPGRWVWPVLAAFIGLFVVTFPLALYRS